MTEPQPASDATDQRPRRRVLRPAVVIPGAVILVVGLVLASLAFQPWKLFIDDTVDEGVPVAAVTATTPAAPNNSADSSGDAGNDGRVGQQDPEVLAQGKFISHEHETTGTARILQLADGRRVLRLAGLQTSNGPDLKVWLAAAPVLPGRDGWFVFDDDEYVDLGALKGNVGNQNYDIPADVDLESYDSVAIWCDRFSVSFGAAALDA
jgi:hypothetical protein